MNRRSFLHSNVDRYIQEEDTSMENEMEGLDFDFGDDTDDTTPDTNEEPTDSTEPTSSGESTRAQFKDKAYFDEYITTQRERIEKISSEPNSSSESGERMLGNMYMDLISAEYSDGMSKEEISADVNDMFSHIKTVDSYGAMVDYLSLAILFNISNDKISSILSNDQYDDDLVSKLKDALGSTASGEGVKYENYQTFDDMLNDKISSEEFLNYVNNNWYDDSKDRYWYDSHNSSENTYTGYWCWVGAAVAQIKNIDTNGSKYIPSELISSTPTQESYVMEAFGEVLAKEWIKKPEVIKEINDGIDEMFTSLFSFGIKPTEADLAENRKKILAKNIEPHILMSMYAKKSFDAMLKEEQRLEEEKMRKEMDDLRAKIMARRGKPTQEGFVQEGMFDAGFNNLRLKLANALGDKFKVTNVMKGMGGKDKFDITEADGDGVIKTTVESTGNGCKVVTRGDGKFKCNFNNVPLSAAFNKIVELFNTPELLLEGARYDISRFSRFYQESDDDMPKPEDDDTESTVEVEVTEETSDDGDDIDVSSFGTDTSDVQNEYDPKEIDSMNKLIAAESEAINDYFDASKDTKDENLRRLYSDIGHEERFHLEQLLYAKSTLTGERYEPRDPDVKKEYEELLAMGMDEDTAMSTAIDKTNLNSSEDSGKDEEEIAEEAAVLYNNLYNNMIITEYCLKAIDDKTKKNTIMDANTKFILEAYYQEAISNVSQAPKGYKDYPNPLKLITKGFKAAIHGLVNMSHMVRDNMAKSRMKRDQRKDWLSRHDITDLFKGGVNLFFYNDAAQMYDFDSPCRYVDLLYRLTKAIGETVGVKLTQQAQHRTITNPIKFRNIEDGINQLNGIILNKTKVVVTDKNKAAIAREFFGYSDKKLDVVMNHGNGNAKDSDNIYNKLDAMIIITKQYSDISIAVLNEIEKMQGDTNSVYYKNRKLYNQSIDQIKVVINKFNQFISCMAHDLKECTRIDSDLIKLTRERDAAEQNGQKWEGADIRVNTQTQPTGPQYAKQKKGLFGRK